MVPGPVRANPWMDEGRSDEPSETKPVRAQSPVEVAMRNPVLDLLRLVLAAIIVALWMWKMVLPALWR